RCLRAQQGSDRRRIGIDYALSHDRSRLVHHTDRCLLQRHVQSNIVHHCCSPSLRGHIKMASYVAGELIPWAFVWLAIPELPHVAKLDCSWPSGSAVSFGHRIMAGLLIMAAGNYWMSQLNLEISPGQVVWARVVLVLGLSICFAPANVAAYLYTPPLLRGAAVGLLSLLRNEGGSVGTSMAQTLQERRDQFHTLRLGESLDSLNQAVVSFLEQARGVFLQQTGDPVAAQQLALQALENLRQQQASALAYFDVFLLLAVVTAVLVPVVLLMKRSVAEKGAHIGHE